jgi:hypothetical protein
MNPFHLLYMGYDIVMNFVDALMHICVDLIFIIVVSCKKIYLMAS